MRPTRRTQPYRSKTGPRQAGPALSNMLRGRDANGGNPIDVRRKLIKQSRSLAEEMKQHRKPVDLSKLPGSNVRKRKKRV